MKFMLKKIGCFCLAIMIVLSMVSCDNISMGMPSSTIENSETSAKTSKETTKVSQTKETTKATKTTATTKATETTNVEQTTQTMETAEVTESTSVSEIMVWIPKSGKKYHSTPSCSNMKNPSEVTLSKAIESKYEPCSKCH